LDVDLRRLTGRQDDLVATWQLRAAGWDRRTVHHWATKEAWRQIHDGVWALNQAPLTRRQLHVAAILTAPHTFLAAESACDRHGFIEWKNGYETVVRPGSGGKRRYPGLVVARSTVLDGQTMRKDGIPIVSAPRALIDVAPRLNSLQLGRGFRECVRLRCATANEIARALAGQRGSRALGDLCDRYASIPYHRCRSDAESRALEVLHDAGVQAPEVNVRIAGREADLLWRRWKLIAEVDGPHHRPHSLLALVNEPFG
jgi:hypothetical protein